MVKAIARHTFARHAAALGAVNLLAHFLPFERAARSLDDLGCFVTLKYLTGMSLPEFLIKEMAVSPNRPLGVVMYLLQMVAGDSPLRAVATVFVASSLLTVAIYVLLRELLQDASMALLGSLIYLLLPNKLELYYTLDYASLNLYHTAYVASFICFVVFARTAKVRFLIGSIAAYTVGIFSYELGFFLPLVLAAYALLFARGAAARSVLWFAIPAAGYALWRTGAFGLVPQAAAANPIQVNSIASNIFHALPNHYLGRYMAKPILYGLYRFPTIEWPWLAAIACADLAALYWFARWATRTAFGRISIGMVCLATVIFVALLIPILLWGGVLGRHTVLASIGLVIVLAGAAIATRHGAAILTVLFGLGLAISQGTAWTQVVAGRMNHAIYETLLAQQAEVLKADRVLIDQYSFATRVPYTWVQDRHNQLDTYWGVGGLLGRGFPFLVHLAVGASKPVYVVRSAIERGGEELTFQVYNPARYQLEETTVPVHGTIVVDYASVYGGRGMKWR